MIELFMMSACLIFIFYIFPALVITMFRAFHDYIYLWIVFTLAMIVGVAVIGVIL